MRSVIIKALLGQLVYTGLQIFNVKRWNNLWMISDFWFNIPLFFFGKIFQVCLASLPVYLYM